MAERHKVWGAGQKAGAPDIESSTLWYLCWASRLSVILADWMDGCVGHQSNAEEACRGVCWSPVWTPSLRVRSLPTRDLFISIFYRDHVRPLLGWGVGHCVCAVPIVHHVHRLHQAWGQRWMFWVTVWPALYSTLGWVQKESHSSPRAIGFHWWVTQRQAGHNQRPKKSQDTGSPIHGSRNDPKRHL